MTRRVDPARLAAARNDALAGLAYKRTRLVVTRCTSGRDCELGDAWTGLDDHYADLPPSNPAYKYWTLNDMQRDPDPISGLAEALRHADAVTSPSKVILQDWSHIATGLWLPNWAMQRWYAGLDPKPIGAPDMIIDYESESGSVPNGALQKMEQPNLKIRIRPRENSEDLIMLGWGGSISHVDSWLYSGIIPAIEQLFAKWPQLRLKFCGSETRLNDLVLNRWGDRVIRQSGVAPRDWPLVVSTFDIGLAPLDTRPLDPPWREGAPTASYDERRSWLKACEYLCAGVPRAASRSLTYQDLAQHGSIVSTIQWVGIQTFPANPHIPIFMGVFEHVSEQGLERCPGFFDVFPTIAYEEDRQLTQTKNRSNNEKTRQNLSGPSGRLPKNVSA